MDGASAKKSTSFETLVIQNITNVSELKAKLNDIIKTGKDYDYDVSSCLKALINSSDQDIVLLSIQAVSELVKCEEKRETYADKAIIAPILGILQKDITTENVELIKQCCRALGNLCCDCDNSRQIILESGGIPILIKLLERSFNMKLEAIQMLVAKSLLNYSIGGSEFSESIVKGGLIEVLARILSMELEKVDFDDDMISTCLLILSVINDNSPEFLFEETINKLVLKILKDTTNVEISELCVDHLLTQAEHDSVKTLLANEGGVQLVCARLEQLVDKHDAGDLNADDTEVQSIMKQACDLVIIVLTGDEAMRILYKNGMGEVYISMVKWLDSPNYHLLTTAVLAIGNFARQDDYCIQMMQDNIFDKLLDIFETYHKLEIRSSAGPQPVAGATLSKLQHGAVSALRNLSVARDNKRRAAAAGRAAPALLRALPLVRDHHVAYKLLATLRMLLDGQESVAKLLASDAEALASVARWGHAPEHTGAGGEAPRLLAWAVKQLRHHPHWAHIVQVDGCISSLVNMLVASHSLMQNEAILALTLLAIESLKKLSPDEQTDYDYGKSFTSQLIKSEIGKHVTILVDTNCAKMPVEVAENLLAFLDITSKNNEVQLDYKEAKVHETLKKFRDSRNDLSDDMKICISGIVSAISDNGTSV
ncbi:unnamed protein product [Arctia plantaginis]|uniref:Uncharacterized protein n=1 Tax=Arctia plantaginis TaxID=874455 RepID=A0A8S1BHJ5_ARCPL|nr:unnamed protein product [Arctia plantaginis]